MTKANIDKFISELEKKNSWGKNEVIDLFKEWVIVTLLEQLPKQGDTIAWREPTPNPLAE